MTNETWTRLHAAMADLSAACDYANERDGAGFSSADASIGHYLGEGDVTAWNIEEAATAATLATKYKGQLGIDSYRDLVDTDELSAIDEYRTSEYREQVRERAAAKREVTKTADKRAKATLTVDADTVRLVTAYDPEVVSAQRALPGRSWDGSANTFPLSSLPAVITMCDEFGIPVTAAVRAQGDEVTELASVDPTALQPVAVTLDENTATLTIKAPYDPELNQWLRAINGDRSTWKNSDRVHRIAAAAGATDLIGLFSRLNLKVDKAAAAALESLAAIEAHRPQVELTADTDSGAQLLTFNHIDPEVSDLLRSAAGGTLRYPRNGLPQIPVDHSPAAILALCEDFDLTIDEGTRMVLEILAADQDEKMALSVTDGTDTEPVVIDELGITLMPHQHAAVRYAHTNRRVLLADEMGLGKTYESLAAIAYDKAFPAVIVCKPDLIGNWRKEIEACLPGRSTYVAEGMTAQSIPGGIDIVLIGFNALGATAKNPVYVLPEGDDEGAVDYANPDDVTRVAADLLTRHAAAPIVPGTDDVLVIETAAPREWLTALTTALPDLSVSGANPDTADIIVTSPGGRKYIPKQKRFGWAEAITAYEPTGFIIDEGHFGKEVTSARSQAMAVVGRDVAARDGMILDLTGTPLVNRPRELAQQLVILGYLAPQNVRDRNHTYRFGEFGAFLFRYCGPKRDGEYGWTFNGASHLDELHTRLRAWGLYMRRRTDVLHDLPAFTMSVWNIDPADLDPELWEHYQAAEADTVNDLVAAAQSYAKALGVPVTDPAVKKAMAADTSHHLAKLNKLRQIIGTAKTPVIEQWIADKVAGGEKVMVAAHHRPVVTRFAKAFGGLRIQGEQTLKAKEADKARFQTESVAEAPVISVSIAAGGVGHTLTAAHIGIQAEQCWTPGEVNQMAKRIHRIGQTHDVDYTIAIVPGTIDESMWTMIGDKQGVVSAVLDGEVSTADQASTDTATSAAAEVIWDFITTEQATK